MGVTLGSQPEPNSFDYPHFASKQVVHEALFLFSKFQHFQNFTLNLFVDNIKTFNGSSLLIWPREQHWYGPQFRLGQMCDTRLRRELPEITILLCEPHEPEHECR